MPLAFRF